jgi:hypothetical protein
MKKFNSFIRGLIIGIIVGAVSCIIITSYLDQETKTTLIDENGNIVVEDNIMSKTLVDFQDAILQKEIEKNELIVMEQPISITMTVSEMGLGNWEIFSKTKQITFKGTGVYTVNLSTLSKNDIDLDSENKVITINVDGSQLTYVNLNIEETEYEETDKGLLSFGDINLTTEQQQQLELQVKQAMTKSLDSVKYKDLADGFAQINIWKIYQPVVTFVENDYTTKVNIN